MFGFLIFTCDLNYVPIPLFLFSWVLVPSFLLPSCSSKFSFHFSQSILSAFRVGRVRASHCEPDAIFPVLDQVEPDYLLGFLSNCMRTLLKNIEISKVMLPVDVFEDVMLTVSAPKVGQQASVSNQDPWT